MTAWSSTLALIKYFIYQTAKSSYFWHLIREKVQFWLIFVIPKSRDWDTANPGIRDWRKWLGSQDLESWDCNLYCECFMWHFVVSNLRLDSMAQILTHCNVRSGSRLMVVESCNGLLLGAILERMAGIYAIISCGHLNRAHFWPICLSVHPVLTPKLLTKNHWNALKNHNWCQHSAVQ